MPAGNAWTTHARLTGIPASHPVLAAQLMLEYKRVPYVRRDIPNQLQKLVMPMSGYSAGTVPVLRVDGRRVQGSTRIARALDELVPTPPLFPADPALRAQVEELEAWGDATFQETVRTLGKWAAKQDPSSLGPIAAAAALPFPPAVLRLMMPLLAPAILRTLTITRDDARHALAALPGELDRIDAAIDAGVIGTAEPNAADFQLATSVRLATLIDDLAPVLAGRPATALAHRLVPDYPGRFRAPLGLG